MENVKDAVSSGLMNPMGKVQLTILNTGFIKIKDNQSKVSRMVPSKPFELNGNFEKHVALLDKYKVLLKIEYHVSLSAPSEILTIAVHHLTFLKDL